jgi:hypothetical protein
MKPKLVSPVVGSGETTARLCSPAIQTAKSKVDEHYAIPLWIKARRTATFGGHV